MEEDYKYIEQQHYDSAIESVKKTVKTSSGVNDKVLRLSHDYLMKKVKLLIAEKPVVMLDYGCGPGERLLDLVGPDVKLYGIDISGKSIEHANNLRINNAKFEVMDCENTTFPDCFFDVIVDYGTFSSLNYPKAIAEIHRILKPGGFLASIETFGHNPIANIKRHFNVLFGNRTKWASLHIMKTNDWEYAQKFFSEVEMKYFGLATLILAPVLKILPSSYHDPLLRKFEKIDTFLLNKKQLQKYAFKTVVFLHKPTQSGK